MSNPAGSPEKSTHCPRCQSSSGGLIKIEAGMRLGLKTAKMDKDLPEMVCSACYQELSGFVSQGAKLRAELKVKASNRADMWTKGVSLVKLGRDLMTKREFAEAAMVYEKYLRVLELVFEVIPGGIHPDLFKNTSMQKELVVITSVYWDLLRIYDSNPRYADQQMKAAQKLAEFVRHTAIFADIAGKAADFSKKAKNKAPFELFLKEAKVRHSRCFIASAAFESHDCLVVWRLRLFRDHVLKKYSWGRALVKSYYRHSPRIAQKIESSSFLKPPIRLILRAASRIVVWTFRLKSDAKSVNRKLCGSSNRS